MSTGAGADGRARRVVGGVHGPLSRDDVLESSRRAGGSEAGRLVAERLRLLGHGWRLVDDVERLGGRRPDLDHVAVGPTGVWVVAASAWTGRVEVSGGVLRQDGHRREDLCEAVTVAGAAVSAVLEPQHRRLVRPVVCLAGQGRELPVTVTASRTSVVGLVHLTALVASGRQRLSPAEVIALHRYLAARLGGGAQAALPSPVDPDRGGAVGRRFLGERPSPGGLSRQPGVWARAVLGLGAAVLLVADAPVWVPVLHERVGSALVPALLPDEPAPAPREVVPGR